MNTVKEIAAFLETEQSIRFTQDQVRNITHRIRFAEFDPNDLGDHGVRVATALFNEVLKHPNTDNILGSQTRTASFIAEGSACPSCKGQMVAAKLADDSMSCYCPSCRVVGVVGLNHHKSLHEERYNHDHSRIHQAQDSRSF